MNAQRIALLITGIFLVAASVGSAVYYEGAVGLVIPFMAPVFLLPDRIGSDLLLWLAAIAVAVIVFGIGSFAWELCRPIFTYSFIAGVIILVLAGEVLSFLMGNAG